MLSRVTAFDRAFRLTFMPLVLLAFILVFSAACKGGAPGANVTESLLAEAGNHPSQDAGGIAEEIAGLEAPTDVDPGLFDALKKAFAAKVKECERFTSSAPTGDSGRVTDLEYDPASGSLSWSYVNAGDCDLSGDVGISDITPIAEHYGEAVEYNEDGKPTGDPETPEGALNHLRAWIDCDHSGEVGISDITPIAENYLAEVAKYAIITSDDPESGWNEVMYSYPPDPPFDAPPVFNIPIPTTTGAFIAVRPLDSDGKPGAVGNIVTLADFVPAHVESVSPIKGVAGTQIVFTASVVGTPPVAYEWHFGGGAEPDVSYKPAPTVFLADEGYYDASLTVTNAFGSDTFEFTLSVTKLANEDLVPVAQAWPLFGDAPLTVTLVSNGSYNLTGEIVLYEWDFESDGVYDYSAAVPVNVEHEYEGGTWRATLRITDEDGATAAAVTPEITAFADNPNWTFEKVIEYGDYGAGYLTLNIDPETGLPIITYLQDKTFKAAFKNQALMWEIDDGIKIPAFGLQVSNAVIYGDSSIYQVVKFEWESTSKLWTLRRYPDGLWNFETLLEADLETNNPRPMLALDPEGRIGLFYTDVAEAKYAVFDGVNWNYEPTGIDMEIYPWFSCFGYRGDIPWAVLGGRALTILEGREDSWSPTIVGIAPEEDEFGGNSIYCATAGEMQYVLAREGNGKRLHLYSFDGVVWRGETLEFPEIAGSSPYGLAADESNVIAITKLSKEPKETVFAHLHDGEWEFEIVAYGENLSAYYGSLLIHDNTAMFCLNDMDDDVLYLVGRSAFME